MSSRREKSFACAFVTSSGESRVYVRAWNARSAAEALVEALRASDVRDRGTIEVSDSRGREAWRGVYDPTALPATDERDERA
jgi:hypothetical protein